MMRAFSQMRSDPASRLHFNGSKQKFIAAWLQVALCKDHLDAVEWLLAAPRSGTYISALVVDIRRWILEPYLWIGDRLCGVLHRGHYRYGVRHTIESPYIGAKGEHCYYKYGLLHREGAPAVISNDILRYYQNGRPFREVGPTTVAPDFLRYPQGSKLSTISHNYVRKMTFLGKLSITISCYDDGIIIWIRRPHFDGSELTIGNDGCLAFQYDHRPIISNAFCEIVAVLRDYIQTYPIEDICEHEWRRAQEEIQ